VNSALGGHADRCWPNIKDYFHGQASRKIDTSCKIPTVPKSLAILGCSQRKKQTSHPVPAIDRYDGPVFRVFRKYTKEVPGNLLHAFILSGRFGLIASDFLIPRYNRRLVSSDGSALRRKVENQLKRTLDAVQPERLFVSVGRGYWPLLEESLTREVAPAKLVVAAGGIGGRASQLAHWLRSGDRQGDINKWKHTVGEAMLLGTTVRLSREEVLQRAREASVADPTGAHRFETWYVALDAERIAPKWLASVLFCKPVASFRTANARRVLWQLGVETKYADQ
jgi:hypothetical protein